MNLIRTIAENLEAYQGGAEDAPVLRAGREGGHGLDNLEGIAVERGVADIVDSSPRSSWRPLDWRTVTTRLLVKMALFLRAANS
jgi:hypothetical protein